MNKYENSVIYILRCNDPSKSFYIGSTTQYKKREQQHKWNCNSIKSSHYDEPLYKYIRENGYMRSWSFDILEECKVDNKDMLIKRERWWYDKLKPTLNKNVPGRTIEEWTSTHVRTPDFIEKKRIFNKKYRESNSHVKFMCDCERPYSNYNIHKKSKVHKTYLSNMFNVISILFFIAVELEIN